MNLFVKKEDRVINLISSSMHGGGVARRANKNRNRVHYLLMGGGEEPVTKEDSLTPAEGRKAWNCKALRQQN